MTASRRLARWALGLADEDVPHRVRHAVARHILDGTGCAIAAARLGEAAAAVEVAVDLGGPPHATVIGGTKLAAPNTALANGALLHALDFDDTHPEALVHVTAAVLPAALASAEAVGASGSELLTACTAGFETVIRLGAAVRHGFHARGFHATSVCGVFAAALVGCRLHGLDEDASVAALGIAGSLAAGSLQFLQDGTSTKQLHPGLAAHSGLLAARLAAAGASGPEEIFEGVSGLYASYAGHAIDGEALFADLGSSWHSQAITIKPYPACQLSHASLDAVLSAGVEARDVESIMFRVPRDAVEIICEPLAAKRDPASPYEAKFSLPWCAAAVLVDGGLPVSAFDPATIGRAAVLELAGRIGYEPYDADVPAASAPGEARIVLRDGGELRGRVDASRGGYDSPLSDTEVLAKFDANAPQSDRLAEILLDLDAAGELTELSSLLARSGAAA